MKAKNTIASILYVLFAVVFIVTHMMSMSAMIANCAIALTGLLALVHCIFSYGFGRFNTHLILWGFGFTSFLTLSILYNGNADLLNILWIWAYMGIGAMMYEFTIPKKVYWAVAYGFMVCIIVHIAQGGLPADFLTMGSENNISVYMIFFVLVAYLPQMKEEKSPLNYLPAFLALAISLWAGNRGGVLATGVMISCVFLYNFLSVKKGKLSSVLKISVLVAAGIYLLNHYGEEFIQAYTNKVDRYGQESERTLIWNEYLSGAFRNLGNFLFGADTHDMAFIYLPAVAGNTHNSFLTMHAKFGLLAFLSLIALLIAVVRKSLKEKNGILLLVLTTASTRMFLDWMAFPGIYDVLFWYMLLYVLDRNTGKGSANAPKLNRNLVPTVEQGT